MPVLQVRYTEMKFTAVPINWSDMDDQSKPGGSGLDRSERVCNRHVAVPPHEPASDNSD